MSTEHSIQVTEAVTADAALVDAFNRLLPQLSESALLLSVERVREILDTPCNTVFVARDAGNRIMGMLTLIVFRIPTGIRAWIEDVVVDETARGRGVGERLMRAAVRRAEEKGARTIELTSRPSKVAANRFYRRLGFVRRETNVYRLH